MAEDEALAYDEKVAMEILKKEYDWYIDVKNYMEKTFERSNLRKKVDRKLLLDALMKMSSTCWMLLGLMTSIEIHHKDFSNHKSLINDQRAKLYNLLFESSHKVSDLALKDYFASFQPSTNPLPFPDSDSKEDKDGETSSQSENSNISSKTEHKMITRKRKRSPGEEEEESDGLGVIHPPLPQPEEITKKRKRFPGDGEDDEAEEEKSDGIYHLIPPPALMVFEDGYLSANDDMYHGYCKCGLNYFDDDDDDDYFDF